MGNVWGGDYIPFSIDIKNPHTNEWYYSQEKGLNKVLLPNYAGGSMDSAWQTDQLFWTRGEHSKMTIQAHFNFEDSQILYTSPILDDITIILNRSNAKFILWLIN